MNIVRKKTNKTSARRAALLAAAVMLAAMLFLFAGCNQDGVGIFYQISQEQEQKESKISERNVYQVVEAGSELYALAGRSVFKQVGDDWSNITGNHFAYDIVEYSGLLYININDDDTNLDDGTLYSYDGTTLSSGTSYGTDVHLFEADDTYILVKGVGGVDSVGSTSDAAADVSNETNVTTLVFDGASGSVDNLISIDTIYGVAFGGPLTEQTPTFDVSRSGDYRGLATAGADIYLTTSSGQVYSSSNGVDWFLEDTISSEPVSGSLAVVDIGGTDYLIIGTEDGYYEWDISGSPDVVGPTSTADTTDPAGFEAKYPDLASALILWVYPSATPDEFYLGTSNGLWKRNSSGEFVKL